MKATWKRLEKTFNSLNSPINRLILKGTIDGTLDTISPSNGYKADRYVETSTFIFITESIVDIKKGDTLEINKKTYKVNYVDNPMFANHHLEIELENA